MEELADVAEEGTETIDINNNSQPPPPKKRRDSCALAELLGTTFGGETGPVTTTPENRAEEELKSYRASPCLPLSEKNPLAWWKHHSYEYPLLSKMAKWYLCIPGTSVAAERVFSTAGDIISAQRSNLKSRARRPAPVFTQKHVHTKALVA